MDEKLTPEQELEQKIINGTHTKLIHVQIEQKYNLGMYESQAVQVAAWTDVQDETLDPQDVIDYLSNMLTDSIRRHALYTLLEMIDVRRQQWKELIRSRGDAKESGIMLSVLVDELIALHPELEKLAEEYDAFLHPGMVEEQEQETDYENTHA